MLVKQVQVHPPNPQWPQAFEAEAAQVSRVLGRLCFTFTTSAIEKRALG